MARRENGYRNRILNLLSSLELERLGQDLEPVPLTFKEPFHEQGKPIKHLYFEHRRHLARDRPGRWTVGRERHDRTRGSRRYRCVSRNEERDRSGVLSDSRGWRAHWVRSLAGRSSPRRFAGTHTAALHERADGDARPGSSLQWLPSARTAHVPMAAHDPGSCRLR